MYRIHKVSAHLIDNRRLCSRSFHHTSNGLLWIMPMCHELYLIYHKTSLVLNFFWFEIKDVWKVSNIQWCSQGKRYHFSVSKMVQRTASQYLYSHRNGTHIPQGIYPITKCWLIRDKHVQQTARWYTVKTLFFVGIYFTRSAALKDSAGSYFCIG